MPASSQSPSSPTHYSKKVPLCSAWDISHLLAAWLEEVQVWAGNHQVKILFAVHHPLHTIHAFRLSVRKSVEKNILGSGLFLARCTHILVLFWSFLVFRIEWHIAFFSKIIWTCLPTQKKCSQTNKWSKKFLFVYYKGTLPLGSIWTTTVNAKWKKETYLFIQASGNFVKL